MTGADFRTVERALDQFFTVTYLGDPWQPTVGDYTDAERARESLAEIKLRTAELEAALQRVATPRRPDGTYNLSRAACEQIAREALRERQP